MLFCKFFFLGWTIFYDAISSFDGMIPKVLQVLSLVLVDSGCNSEKLFLSFGYKKKIIG